MAALRILNLGVRFLLELAALGIASYWGYTLRRDFPANVLLAILVPAVIAVVWGMFIAPKARFPTGRHGQAGLGLIVFLLAAGALAQRGHPTAALVFASIATISSLLLYAPTR